jgi:hypothetical protein
MEIRDVRKGVRVRLNKEHVAMGVDSAGGAHKAGSALAYYQASAPTKTPGDVNLGTNDAGRLWVDSDKPSILVFDGTNFLDLNLATSVFAALYPTPRYALYQEHKAKGVDGGSFLKGDWRKRSFTREQADPSSIGSLSSGAVSLDAGTYIAAGRAAAFKVERHITRLYNATAAESLLSGTPAYSDTDYNVQSWSTVRGSFTLTATSSIELQHICEEDKADSGLGCAANLGDAIEIYAELEIWKIA